MNALKTATLCGTSPLEFWELTPFELNCVIQAYASNQKAKQEQQIAIAYAQAHWTIQWLGKRKPKTLKQILEDINKPHKVMTDNEMLETVKQLNAMFGGEVKIEE